MKLALSLLAVALLVAAWRLVPGAAPGDGLGRDAPVIRGERPDAPGEEPELSAPDAHLGDAEREDVSPNVSGAPGAETPPAPSPSGETPSSPATAVASELLLPEDPSLPTEPAVGAIQGSLLPSGEFFPGDPASLVRELHIDLVRKAPTRLLHSAALTPVLDEEGRAVRIDFIAKELPGGEYEVTVSSLTQPRWHPASTYVFPPAENITFRSLDSGPTARLVFEVLDADTGEAIDDWTARKFVSSVSQENGVLLHAGPLDLAAHPLDDPLDWILEADGYAPAFGTATDFQRSPDGDVFRARVSLERGGAARLLVLAPDPELRPAVGAAIRIDGEAPLATDSRGQAFHRWTESPNEIQVTWHDLAAQGAFDEVALPRPGSLRVIVLR